MRVPSGVWVRGTAVGIGGSTKGVVISDQMEAGGELEADDTDGRRPYEGEPMAGGNCNGVGGLPRIASSPMVE